MEVTEHQKLCDMIHQYIADNRLTQKQMASLIGITEATLSKWLSGKSTSMTEGSKTRIRSVCQSAPVVSPDGTPNVMPEFYKRLVCDRVMASTAISNDAKAAVYSLVMSL